MTAGNVDGVPALMWEARARPGARGALLAWVREQAVTLLGGAQRAELFVASGDRVVVIALGAGLPRLPDPPDELVSRPPHAWPFALVEAVAGARADQPRPARPSMDDDGTLISTNP